MASVITLKAIDRAIANLSFRDENVLPYRLVTAIRRFYHDGYSIESLEAIKSDDLIKVLWNTKDDPEEISKKRNNLSSIKSSVNAKLRELYREQRNPDGIIIGSTNIFVMCDEAKDTILKAFLKHFTTKGTATVEQISDILRAVDEILSNPEAVFGAQGTEGSRRLGELKRLVEGLSEKLDIGGLDQWKATNDLDGIEVDEEIEEPDLEEDLEQIEDDEMVEEGEPLDEVLTEEEMEPDEPLESEDIEGSDEAKGIEQLEEVGAEDDLDEVQSFDDLEGTECLGVQGDKETPGGPYEAEAERGSGGSRETVRDDTKTVECADLVGEIVPEEEAVSEGTHEVYVKGESIAVEPAITESDDSEMDDVMEKPEDEEDMEPIEIDDDLEEVDGVEGTEETYLSAGDSGAGYLDGSYEENDKIRKARLLAEEFNSLLGARDRYYNQYILIPQGEYTVGSSQPKKDERPGQVMHLSPFYIGEFPVTNALFEIFVEKTGYRTAAERSGFGTVYRGRFQKRVDEKTGLERTTWNSALVKNAVEGACWYQPLGQGSTLHNKRNHPVVQVSLEDAMAFAAWTGKRLPTEDEWEAASRTAHGYVFPWGNNWEKNSCNIEESSIGDTTPVDRYIAFANEFGIADAVGNVLEWTLDRLEPPCSVDNRSTYCIAKGGSWVSGSDIRLFSRFQFEPDSPSNILGFRCVAY